MDDDPEDATTSLVATMAMLRAVMSYLARIDPSARGWIEEQMLSAAARLTCEDGPEFRRAVEDRAADLFLRGG